ncbi:hypothetical protein NPIL_9631, partial [Nephila pilipes]
IRVRSFEFHLRKRRLSVQINNDAY